LAEGWRCLGISGPFLRALETLYDEVCMMLKVQGRLGDPIRTTRGTKQGSELSPLIFGLFIERLRVLISNRCPGMGPLIGSLRVPELFYADDLALICENPDDMQALLDCLSLFCSLFHMKVNVAKTWGIVFRPKGMTRAVAEARCSWHLEGEPIKLANKQTYLGLLLTPTQGAGLAAASHLAQAGRRAMHALLGRARQLQLDQSALLCRLFDGVVEPILSYGCQIWGPAVCAERMSSLHALDRKFNPGDAVHIDFLRCLGGLPPCSHKWSVLAEFGRRPLLLRWLVLSVRLWLKVKAMPPGRLLREAMNDNVQLFLSKKDGRCWTANLFRCLVQCGALSNGQVQSCRSAADVWSLPIEELGVRQQVSLHLDQLWAHVAPDPRSADSHSVFVSTYRQWVRGVDSAPIGPAPHVGSLLSLHRKAALVRLRVGSYPLRVATGRNEGSGVRNAAAGQRLGARGIPRAERICRLCHSSGFPNAVEDLLHFLCECPAYAHIRALWPQVFQHAHLTPADVLNASDQEAVASAIFSMLRHRREHS